MSEETGEEQEMPSLEDIMDGYLNTGDYDDYLDGWVECVQDEFGNFRIMFTDQKTLKVKIFHLRQTD